MTHEESRSTLEPPEDASSATASDREALANSVAGSDAPLDALRNILFSRYRQQIDELRAEVDDLERQVTDREALVDTISPLLGDLIRRKVRDAREEMIDALYPIIGQVVMRAVGEAIRDLVRTTDARMRSSLSPRSLWRRLRARLGGVSDGEMALREALPFAVEDMLLIHRETGLLLWHVPGEQDALPDSDLVSGMLTAIRDFVEDAFGQGEDGDLDAIQYGEQRILIETSRYAYLAVVVDGIEPTGFRAAMRDQVIEISHRYEGVLRDYEGDPSPLAAVDAQLRTLLAEPEPEPLTLSAAQRWVVAGAMAVLLVCFAGACLAGRWAWRAAFVTPTPVVVVLAPTQVPPPTSTATWTATARPTATALPTATATATATPTATPTATSTATSTPVPPTLTPTQVTPTPMLTPTPPFVGAVMTGSVYVRQGPGLEYDLLGLVLERGRSVDILAVQGNWAQVRWAPQGGAQIVGWVPVTWVGTLTPVPEWMITPTVVP